MESAARLCATLVENARRLFARAIPSTAEQKTRERVLAFVRVAGHVKRSDLLRNLHISAHQLTRAALTLIEEESIMMSSEGQGKTATVWYTSAEKAAAVCL
jgi:predicted ArsR family transcriptional regulator